MASLPLVQLCVILLVGITSKAEELPLSIERRAGGTDYSTTEQYFLLNAHNNYRRSVSPPAVSMNTLTWDATLAIKAQQWVERCHYGHPNTAIYRSYAGLGQNLYIRIGTTTKPPVTDPVDKWYREVNYYNLATNKCDTGRVCGHYTQLVWADTSKVGCGINFCSRVTTDYGRIYSTAWLVACQYSPGGNVIWRKPYVAAG
ncbi:Peptidase inhibitor 16 [Holothuria leucospilota]|uniref:Peptidase inhibitor 16 n=1 Tax=Holothuria leucospilota TaxID=206669 RepID=A0A9Q1CBF5_HOLLE|nr:Peptidase inhibitor 16 [Holothuria leucospilota]